MAFEIYKHRDFLYEYYVKRRMNLVDIQELLEKQYNVKVSHQTIYNWVCKWELEKFRGKGRKIGGNLGKKKMAKRQTSPFHQQQQRIRAQRKGRKRPGT